MTLEPGAHLGHYEILGPLGAGGMGEVYRARDTKLHRDVALKLLPEHLAKREIDRERFTREARAVAALNHPNIVTLYSVEEVDDVHFLTMELVDGEALATGIPRRGLPVGEFLKVAIPLADAVHAAHEKGIVHRDLKPTNVMLTAEGRVKVLDFGLAKLRAALEGDAEATTRELTGEGRIVGTIAYMSPEQAEGKPLDHRTDIFSLGVVLYELATGKRPFTGDTPASVMSAVIKDEPTSARDLNPALPAPLARVIKMCLRKDPDRRYQSAKDVRNELQQLEQEWSSGELEAGSAAVVPSGRRWVLPVVGGVTGIGVVALAFWGSGLWSAGGTPRPMLSNPARLTATPDVESSPSISPDGEFVVYVSSASGNPDIWLHRVGDEEPLKNLTADSPGNDTQPEYSPDGNFIAFRSDREGGGIFIMGATGGAARKITDSGSAPTWSPDGTAIAFNRGNVTQPGASLWIVDVETRQVEELGVEGGAPAWSPDGRWIAYSWHQVDVFVVSKDGGNPVRVTDTKGRMELSPAWSPDSQFLYFTSNRGGGSLMIWRVRIDSESGEPVGDFEAMPIAAVRAGGISFARNANRVAYVESRISGDFFRVGYDATTGSLSGEEDQLTADSRVYSFAAPAPDGEHFVIQTQGDTGMTLDGENFFVGTIGDPNWRQLTDDDHLNRNPVWSPDGSIIAFWSMHQVGTADMTAEIYTIDPGTLEVKKLTDMRRGHSHPDGPRSEWMALNPIWSPDGARMAFTDNLARTAYIFDPYRPWAEQTPIEIPDPANRPHATNFTVGSWSQRWGLLGCLGGEQTDGSTKVPAAYDIETQQYSILSEVAGCVGFPSWLNDGRVLLMFGGSAYLLDPADETRRELLTPNDRGGVRSVRPSVDNQYIYYIRRKSEADIWTADVTTRR